MYTCVFNVYRCYGWERNAMGKQKEPFANCLYSTCICGTWQFTAFSKIFPFILSTCTLLCHKRSGGSVVIRRSWVRIPAGSWVFFRIFNNDLAWYIVFPSFRLLDNLTCTFVFTCLHVYLQFFFRGVEQAGQFILPPWNWLCPCPWDSLWSIIFPSPTPSILGSPDSPPEN